MDNSLTIADHIALSHPVMKLFADDFLYRDPILLEDVDDVKFLFTIRLQATNVKYIVPSDKYMYMYRSPDSANTERANLSSLCSRVHVLARGSFPKRNISASANIALGFHRNVVMSTINQMLKLYRSKA